MAPFGTARGPKWDRMPAFKGVVEHDGLRSGNPHEGAIRGDEGARLAISCLASSTRIEMPTPRRRSSCVRGSQRRFSATLCAARSPKIAISGALRLAAKTASAACTPLPVSTGTPAGGMRRNGKVLISDGGQNSAYDSLFI